MDNTFSDFYYQIFPDESSTIQWHGEFAKTDSNQTNSFLGCNIYTLGSLGEPKPQAPK